jgi:CRISPR-associated protein Csh2
METIKNRSEIIFLYDTSNCNPNGDPMDANRPRMVEETGKCLVTDVRLKRTVRDYLFNKGYNGKENGLGDIFVRDEDNGPVTGATRSDAYDNKEDFIGKFIDARLFGAVSAPKGKSEKTFNITGPVQFGMGKSLHRVKENFIKGTGAFTTSETATQRTFREEFNISYGLIGFHGVINENAAVETNLTETDVAELMDGLWNGTKSLLTRSKKGHMPRLLIKIDYSKNGFFIGDLVERLGMDINEGIKVEELEGVDQFTLNTDKLVAVLERHKDKIERITVYQDDRLRVSTNINEVNPTHHESISI